MGIVGVGGTLEAYEVSLRVVGDLLVPSEVTQLLECAPDEAFEKGHLLSKRAGAIASKGLWTVGTKTTPRGLSSSIVELLGRTTADSDIWKRLTASFSCDVLIGAWMTSDNTMWSIEPSALEALLVRGLTLEFDVYGPEPSS